jgi:DNA topoisomerase-3
LGTCPKCGARVFEHGMSYVCEKSVGPEKSCDFRTGKIILQQEISREQASKLLDEGRTDLLPGFISTRTRRKFKAFLVRGADGKVGFEFEPRPARPGAAKRTAGKGAGDGGKAADAKPARKTATNAAGTAAAKKVAKATGGKTAAGRAKAKSPRSAAAKNSAVKADGATKGPARKKG